MAEKMPEPKESKEGEKKPTRREALYDKSKSKPKVESKSKSEDKGGDGEGGKKEPSHHDRHAMERSEANKRHEKERRDMHGSHREELRKMADRHNGELKAMAAKHDQEALGAPGSEGDAAMVSGDGGPGGTPQMAENAPPAEA